MHLPFIDESGTIPPQSKSDDVECFILRGIIIPKDLWHEIDKEITQLKNKYNVIGEIKWR